jgi:ABC-type transport system substrate-binding protein
VWVANGRDGSVIRVDARTGERMSAPIRVGSGPRGIVRAGHEVWVTNELSQNVTRIDVATGRTHTVDVGDGPTAVAVLGGGVWVAEKYSGDLLRLDPRTGKQTRYDVGGDLRGLAVVGGRLWVSSGASPSTGHLGGTVRVATGDLPGSFSGRDPAGAYDRDALHAERIVYDGLLTYNYTQAAPQVLVPDLATSVPEPTDGGRTYTFNLRPGIRYSTGREVKASDFVRGVTRALFASQGRPDFYAGIVGGQACIDHEAACDLNRGVVADDAARRVTFHLRAPDPQFLHKLTLLVVPAPPGTPLRRLTSPMPGTGPYRFAASTGHKRFVLSRNRYFREWSAAAQPAGFPDRIIWAKVADARAAGDAVRHGRADLAELTPLGANGWQGGRLVDDLRIDMPTRLHRSVLQGVAFGVLDSARPPFDKLRARQAFNYAVDRTEVVRILGGPSVTVETCQLIPPGFPSYQRYCPYTLGRSDGVYRAPELAKARHLVKASGTFGAKVTVTDMVGDYNPPLETYFAQVLRQIGYKVTLRRIPDTPRNEDFFNDPRSGIQVETGGWFADFPLPSNFYDLVSCPGAGYPANHCDRELDRRAAAATAMLATDPGAALRAWTRIDHEVTDQAALVPVANFVTWWVTSKRVGNYQSGDVGPLLSQLWAR